MIGEFKQDGRVYEIESPITPRNWSNKLFNDRYLLELNSQMQGSSQTFENFMPALQIPAERHFYILNRENDKVFCPLYAPLRTKAEKYIRRYGLFFDEAQSENDGIKTLITAFVHECEQKEYWRVILENTGDKELNISFFTAFSMDIRSYMGSHCHYEEKGNFIYRYSFPGHALYEDKAKLDSAVKVAYMTCDEKPHSYDTNKFRFYGCEDTGEYPLALINKMCANSCTQGEEGMIAAMEHRILLKPGMKKTLYFSAGAAVEKEDIRQVSQSEYDTEFENISLLWEKRCNVYKFNSGNENIDTLSNYWLKKQLTFMTRTNRFYFSSPVRNELQDIMGYAFVDKKDAIERIRKIMQRQRLDGYIKQWNFHNGAPEFGLAALRLSDAPIWLMICSIEVITHIIKDNSLYEEKAAYKDCDTQESFYEHLKRAAMFMSSESELGEHGICLMRDGDWTDPINAVGRKGRGESVWNTMALIYAIKELCKIFPDEELLARAQMLKENINKHCWDGEWYLAAIDDDGRKVGTNEDEEGKILINPQTWAIISGVAEGERLEKIRKHIESMKTDFGYKLSHPPFTKWNEKFGKISIKQLGALENGSVYCHGTMFKAFADFLIGDNRSVLECIENTLPTNPKNPNEINLQLPLYASNYYFGVENENYGRSSCAYGTGTTAWILVLLGRMGMIGE